MKIQKKIFEAAIRIILSLQVIVYSFLNIFEVGKDNL